MTDASAVPDSERGIRPPGGGRGAVLKSLLPTMVIDVALPVATYYVLHGAGMSPFWALLISGVWPLLGQVVSIARRRRLDEFGLFILVLIVLGALTSLLFRDARFLLLKDSAFTGVLGIVFLASLLLRRPLMFYFGRKFGTDGSDEGLARWDGFWRDLSVFRHGQRTMTAVWGTVFLLEAVVRIPLALTLPLSVMVPVSSVMPFVVIAVLMVWCISYARHNAAASRAQAAELRAAPTAA